MDTFTQFIYNLHDTFNTILRGNEKCAHEQKLTQQIGHSWPHCINLIQVIQTKTRMSNTTRHYELKARLEIRKMKRVHLHAGGK